MIKLNDYLYNGDTILKILHLYSHDLKTNARIEENHIDMAHANFLIQIAELLEHNDFLTLQSQRIREFYRYMASEYPYLAFTFRGRIKSLIRAEEKFNRFVIEYTHDYYEKNHRLPTDVELKSKLTRFRDLIAYRIVISLPKCHLKSTDNRREIELEHLYRIANVLPSFLEERGFTAEIAAEDQKQFSPLLNDDVKLYYKDFIANQKPSGYESLHITFYDNMSRCYTEVQLRTKDMDDFSIIGPANHFGYEQSQKADKNRKDFLRPGECRYYDEAFERLENLESIDYSRVDVNMFTAVSNILMNDGCGLYRGRQILPFEHLSRFQNDLVD